MAEDTQQILDTLLSLGARLGRGSPFETAAAELCGKLAFLGGARALALFGFDAEHQQIWLVGAYGLGQDYVRRFPTHERRAVSLLPGDLRDCALRGQMVSVVGITDDPRTVSLAGVARQGRLASTLALPLIFQNSMVGLVHAFYGQHLRPERQQVLVRASAFLASALAMDRMRQRLDGVGDAPDSGLYSRAQVERQIRHAHAAAERYELPYSVVVYAVDRPSVLERRYGPLLVRSAVHELLRLVAEECRTSDQAGHYEDASCQVVLPGTEQHGAFTQCERVLERFGRMAFKSGDARLQLSASAGISCFPENGALTGDDAIRSARRALRAALGRDAQRVVAIAARGSALPID